MQMHMLICIFTGHTCNLVGNAVPRFNQCLAKTNIGLCVRSDR